MRFFKRIAKWVAILFFKKKQRNNSPPAARGCHCVHNFSFYSEVYKPICTHVRVRGFRYSNQNLKFKLKTVSTITFNGIMFIVNFSVHYFCTYFDISIEIQNAVTTKLL